MSNLQREGDSQRKIFPMLVDSPRGCNSQSSKGLKISLLYYHASPNKHTLKNYLFERITERKGRDKTETFHLPIYFSEWLK